MYEKCPAELRMSRMVLKDGYFDETSHSCKIITYNPDEECIYFLSEETELPIFSLDGIYECHIETSNGNIGCNGFIEERYWNKSGKILKFQIRNGFYKKLVN